MWLQLLLEEPKYSNILDTVLDINASNAQKNFYVNEYLDSTYHKADDGVLNSSFTEGNKTVEQFVDGVSEENFNMVACEENSDLDACKDYLLDVMFDERLHSVLNKEIYTKFDKQKLSSTREIENSKKTRTWLLPNFDLPGDNSHIGQNMKIQLQITSAQRSATRVFKSSLELSSSQNNLRVDEMSSDKLRKKLFGHQTIITDEHWLRHHISLGLQKSDKWKKNSSLKEFSIPNENKRVEVSSATEDLLKAPTPFSGVFSFKRKQRVQRVKKKKGNSAFCESLKNFFSECGRKKPEIRKKHTKDNVLHDREGSNEHFRACTEVPREDTITRNEGHDHSSKRHEDNCDSLVESVEEDDDDDTYTGESEDDTSENEWKTEKIQHHRKNHFWSLTEVTNLVQGVSKYGVGRWIQIKRLFFRSSPHRTPADLKDKWRNLLSASCGRSQKRRLRPRQNGIPHSIPQHILHWVRDLAATHPYPRKKKKSGKPPPLPSGLQILPQERNSLL
ncbi:PREDICTED: uncharacterized protein LOC109173627 isoform X2 [Ipomoea nil]|nr:PREDICTED: uncharacterized protein LOC109173627 isoform X2 [Ipomoea nil]